MDTTIKARCQEFKSEMEAKLKTQSLKLEEQNEETLKREKSRLDDFFQEMKVSLQNNHHQQLSYAQTMFNKEISLKIETKDATIKELKQSVEKHKLQNKELKRTNQNLKHKYESDFQEKMKFKAIEDEKMLVSKIDSEKMKLEAEMNAKWEKLRARKEIEMQDKIDMVINKFGDEIVEKEKLIETLERKILNLEKRKESAERKFRDLENRREVETLKDEVAHLKRQLSRSISDKNSLVSDLRRAEAKNEEQYKKMSVMEIKMEQFQLEVQGQISLF